jgi:RNA polymerase sigma factor (sigma-70 family)
MTQWSDAERFLLDRVRQRDEAAWAQLVGRYQGRLLAYARGRGVSSADAEDFVQDTFIRLLRGMDAFRGEASLETYLFLLLRRRLSEWLRGRREPQTGLPTVDSLPSAPDPTASAYVRNQEQLDRDRTALAQAIAALVNEFQADRNFRDLQLAEMLFYAQMRNNAIAPMLGLDEKYIALLKHRWIARLRTSIDAILGTSKDAAGAAAAESLLTEVWETHRPSCPKRTTLGGYLLGTLTPDWHAYIDFHVNKLDCPFCKANLEDMRGQIAAKTDDFRQRVLQSSVGFFRPSA